MYQLLDGVANSDVSDLKERTKRYINPPLQYAYISWPTHLIGTERIPPMIIPTLHRFLETKFSLWLEVFSILGAVGNAIEVLQTTMDWLEVC